MRGEYYYEEHFDFDLDNDDVERMNTIYSVYDGDVLIFIGCAAGPEKLI